MDRRAALLFLPVMLLTTLAFATVLAVVKPHAGRPDSRSPTGMSLAKVLV